MKEIVAIFPPTIAIDEIGVEDFETGGNDRYPDPDGNETKKSKLAGAISPYIEINGMKFGYELIKKLEIDITGFLPKITLNITEKAGMFISRAYPKDGDVVNVYIRSESKDFKPIRQDYRILDVISPVSRDVTHEANTFTITGILNLPDIFVDKIKSFSEMTSLDVLQEIAKELKLGFATNETATNDSMTWICPYVPYKDFIQNDVVNSAYKDDDSFYACFIDQYYMLNFVQMNDMIVHDKELDEVRVNKLLGTDYHPDGGDEVSSDMADLYYSNAKSASGKPTGIIGYTPINGSGIVSLQNGYRTFLQYYDKDDKDFTQYFMETLNTEESADKVILKGRKTEDHTLQVKTVRFGYQFGDNVHDNYNHAKLQNNYNNSELKKLGLLVNTSGINTLVYRNMSIPVIIITSKGSDLQRLATKKEDTPSAEIGDNMTLDKFLTGWYVIAGMKFVYSARNFHTHNILIRREYETTDV